jgi:hypothetical protein
MATTTESTSNFQCFLLFNMEGSRPGVGNLEAIGVILVFVDIVIREIGNPDIKAEEQSVSTVSSSMIKLTVVE